MNRSVLLENLLNYKAFNYQEESMRLRMIDLLGNEPTCFSRTLLTGHFTASAWVLSADGERVLLIHHAKLNRWLQPGGHCDGDENVRRVAQKELEEETGISAEASLEIFDLDIHQIPERLAVMAHEHFDIRFLFLANATKQPKQNHESLAARWVKLADIEQYTNEESVLRMKAKSMEWISLQ